MLPMRNKAFIIFFSIGFFSPSWAETLPSHEPLENVDSIVEQTAGATDTVELAENFIDDIYSIWSDERVNPYQIKIDSLPDSVRVACSEFVYPTESNRITSKFGLRRARFHYGIDIGVAYGDTIRAAFGGKVRMRRYERRGYGNYLVIRHNNGLETVYAHLSKMFVAKDQEVEAGMPIGLGGSTGRSTGSHLHYEIRFLGQAFDPMKLIDFSEKSCRYETEYLITKAETYSHKPVLDELKKAAYHRVRQGDCLSIIARKYGTSVSQLCRLNKISANSILQIGQRIRYR